MCLLLEQDEMAEDRDVMEEQAKVDHKNILSNIDDHMCAHYRQTFKYIMEHTPYLGSLIGKKKKCEELTHLIGEMQNMVNHTRSEDASRLKSRMGSYAAPNPDKDLVSPPIHDDSKSRSKMGFNHPQLGPLLCPAKFLVEYNKDPAKSQKKIQAGSLRVMAALWPAYLYPGDSPGQDFDPDDIIEGLFRGYLLERVAKHIFTSPSSALSAGASNGTRPCNAKIHGMSVVEAEHIAYAAVQACFGISSLNKWKDKDGLFHYNNFDYRIMRLIRERRDGEWVDSLLAYFNEKLFGNENGAKLTHSESAKCSDDDDMWQWNGSSLRMLHEHPNPLMYHQHSPLHLIDKAHHCLPHPLKLCAPKPQSEVVVPARSPTLEVVVPTPTSPAPITSHKHKDTTTHVDDLFNDDSPLTEEEQEVPQPVKCTRKGGATKPKKASTKHKSRK